MELLSVTMTEGVKKRSELDGKDNSSEDKSNYKLVRAGDMVYNSMRMWQGASGISTIDGIVSPAYTVLTSRHAIANGFFAALFKSHNTIGKFRRYSQGMTSDTWNLKYPQIAPISISIPSLDEQEKIATFLEIFDKRIMKQKQYVEYLKSYKRGVIKSLLDPQNQTTNDPKWVTSKIGDLGEFIKGAPLSKADISSVGKPLILYGELYTTYGEVVYSVVRKTESATDECYLSRVGDVVIPTSGETPEDIATASCIMVPGVVLAGDLAIFRSDKIDGRILSYILTHIVNDQIARIAQGKSIVHIQASEINRIQISYPNSEEQSRIASVLGALDRKIQLCALALERARDVRKGLLQDLFI